VLWEYIFSLERVQTGRQEEMGGSSGLSGKCMKWRNFLLGRRNPKKIARKPCQMKLSSSPSVFCC